MFPEALEEGDMLYAIDAASNIGSPFNLWEATASILREGHNNWIEAFLLRSDMIDKLFKSVNSVHPYEYPQWFPPLVWLCLDVRMSVFLSHPSAWED